ncbi:MAG: cytochrome ubiquinol oxidase subunit I [Anaerolineales bacterium]|jgi:cytochrome d ubiquinol oxidase subunit I
MEHSLLYSRLQFVLTIAFHYLFPQLTMGLALFVLYFKTRALRGDGSIYQQATRFWTRILAITFVFGVATGITMEFQFGTNWSGFSEFAGGVVGQTLAMEGIFAFFLESAFIGILLFGEKRLSPRAHWFAALMVFIGTWLSAYFILATNAWMQNPVAYTSAPHGSAQISSLLGLLTNPWLLWQFLHNQSASIITTSFVVMGVGAFYLLSQKHENFSQTLIRTGLAAAVFASVFQIFPSGDGEARQIYQEQPIKGAAMEGLFQTERGAGIALFGQPNMQTETLDNPIIIPDMLSLLAYHHMLASVQGLDAFPRDEWPDVPIVYYAYHIMVMLGFAFAGITLLAVLLWWRGKLFQYHWILWVLMLAAPLPYIATLGGWVTTEVGRQPWLVYGLFKTAEGVSASLSSGNALFTLLGYIGLYTIAGLLYLMLLLKMINQGPQNSQHEEQP